MGETRIEDKIVLNHNRGKAPPGSGPSPGMGRGHPPENKGDPPDFITRYGNETNMHRYSFPCGKTKGHVNLWKNGIFRAGELHKYKLTIKKLTTIVTNEFKHTNNFLKTSNFLQTLNFTFMKKQIFILFLALFAYSANTFGQVLQPASTRAPKPATNCTGDADSPLNPKPGKSYEYGVTIGNAASLVGGAVTGYSWWATKNAQFVVGTTTPTVSPNWGDRLTVGGGLIAAGTGYGTVGGTSSMTLTWSPQTLAGTKYQGTSPTFVAVMANGACSNNIQVFEINPLPAFTVDITNINTASSTSELYGNTISSCVSPVVSATYNSGNYGIDMDYGKNTIYFEVISANFVGSWTPTITVAGLAAAETASVTIYESWSDAQTQTNGKQTLDFADDGTQVGTVTLGSTVTDTSTGVSIWLGVTVDHNTYETLSTSSIRVTIGGMDTTGQFDLADNCNTVNNVDTDDFATQDITPRPDIDDTTGDPATPVPQTFRTKNP